MLNADVCFIAQFILKLKCVGKHKYINERETETLFIFALDPTSRLFAKIFRFICLILREIPCHSGLYLQ